MNSDNLLPLEKIELGDDTVKALEKCKDVDVLKFRMNAQQHFQSAARHLLEKSVLGKSLKKRTQKILNVSSPLPSKILKVSDK